MACLARDHRGSEELQMRRQQAAQFMSASGLEVVGRLVVDQGRCATADESAESSDESSEVTNVKMCSP